MPRPASTTLTDGELRLMKALWDHGPSTVVEIQARLAEDLVDSTIRTLLRILEEKGYVARSREGRAYRYAALVPRDEARASLVDLLVSRFFSKRADLIANLIDSGDLTERELNEIARLIAERNRRGDG